MPRSNSLTYLLIVRLLLPDKYVKAHGWRWLLLDYLDREEDKEAKKFLQQYVQKHGAAMIDELQRQKSVDGGAGVLSSPYKNRATRVPDYDGLISDLERYIAEYAGQAVVDSSVQSPSLQCEQLKRKASSDAQ